MSKIHTFYEFIDSIKPLIGINELERQAALPKNTLPKHFQWRRTEGQQGQELAATHIPAIIIALSRAFGPLLIGTETFTADKNIPLVVVSHPTPRKERCSEIKPGTFVYTNYSQRDIYEAWELENYFKK